MSDFPGLVAALLARFLLRNGFAVPAESRLREVGERLAGVPVPPGGTTVSSAALEASAEAVAGPGAEEWLREAARQLVKAVTYPELSRCRDSYREVDQEGRCRRQDPARARARISGTHCVDCPHWAGLDGDAHAAWLAAAWREGPAAFAAAREVFLPEDFRQLRREAVGRARNVQLRYT